MFCAATQGLIEMRSDLNEQKGWELFDIVDGRVFFYFLRATRSEGEVPSGILQHAHVLYEETLEGRNLEVKQPFATLKSSKGLCSQPKAEKNLTALPFSHPVLGNLLKDVEIGESEETQDPSADLVFEDLRHWHAYKPVVQLKSHEKTPLWIGKLRQRNMQRVLLVQLARFSIEKPLWSVLNRNRTLVLPAGLPSPSSTNRGPEKEASRAPC
jgi:hypothetical protein